MSAINLDSYEFVALIHAASQSSCGFNRNHINDDKVCHLHCCDYNDPIYKVVQQIELNEIEDEDDRNYIQAILDKGKEYYGGSHD